MAMERFGMFTFVVILVLGVLSRQYLGRALRLPYTVILMVLGALTGLLIENRRNAFELNLKSWYDMTPQVILYCFVPILVFESAFMTDTHIFSRQKWQILTLAGPGVLVASILTGGFVKAVFTDYGWDWPTVLMFGAMMSATDPVAVVALLKELGVSERLGTLIEGESLLNDGTAIVVFDVFKHALEHKPCDAEMPSWQSVLRMLFRLGALGPVVGTAIGWCAATLLGYVLNDPLNEITITLITCYAAFAVAEGIVGTSGVLSVVFGIKRSGSVVGECFKCGDDDDHAADHHRFLYGADARRALSGGYSADVETDCTTFRNRDVYYLLVLYVALHAIRGLVLVLSTPVLRSGIYGMSLNQGLVVAYGGLRGAIGLALALIVNETKGLPDQLQMRMLFHVSGIAILTLCVNGTTMVHVLNWTGLSKKTDAEDEIFAHVTVDVDKKLANEIASLTREQYLGDADWKMVWRYLPVFSVETYWLRLRDGHIVLSDAEREDLASWSEAPRDVGVVQRLLRVLFPRDRRADYRIPALLHRRWVNYHREFGCVAPRFLNLDGGKAPLKERRSMRNDEILAKVTGSAVLKNHAVSAHHGTGGASPLNPLPTSSTSSSAFAAPLLSGDFFGERSKQEKRPSTRDRLSEEMRQQLAASSDEGRTQSARRVSFAEAGVEMTARAPTSFGDDDGRSSRGGSEASSSTPGFARRVFDGVAARFASAPKSPPSSPDSGTFVHSDPKGPAYAPLRVSSLSRSSSSSTVEGGREMLAESRARCLWAIKANYHVAFTHGRLTPHGLRVLVENVDMQTDDESRPLDEWERLEAHDLWPKARLSRIQYLNTYIPSERVRESVQGVIFRRMAFVFEVAYNFIHAHEDVEHALAAEEIVDAGPVQEALVEEVAKMQAMAKATIAEYIDVFPESANAIKTQVAASFVLVRQHELMKESREHGHITAKELGECERHINAARIKLSQHPYTEQMPPIKTLVRDVPFLRPLTEAQLDDLIHDDDACRSEILLAHQTLALEGERSLERRLEHHGRHGWFVIARGSVRLVHDREQHETSRSTATSEEVILSAGAVCCLEEQLLELPFTATYRTLSMVHLVFFDRKEMLALAERHDGVRRGLWWMVVLSALHDYADFQDLPKAALKALEKDATFVEVPELDGEPARYPSFRGRTSTTEGLSFSDRPRRANSRQSVFQSGWNKIKAARRASTFRSPERRPSGSQSPASPMSTMDEDDDEAPESPTSATTPGRNLRFKKSVSKVMKLGAVGLRKRGSESAPPPEPEPPHGTGYWARARTAMKAAEGFKSAAKLNQRGSSVVTVDAAHSLLLIRGTAVVYAERPPEERTRKSLARDALSMDVEDTPSSSSTALGRREVHAVCIVGIAAKESRAVRLSPGAKAFVLSDALLRAHVAGSGAASPVRSSVSVPVSAAALHQLHQRGKGLGPNTYAWLAKTLPSKGAGPLTPASTAPTQSFQMTESTNSTGGFPIESTGGSLDIGDSADAQPVDHMAVLVDDDGEDSGAEDDAAPAAEEAAPELAVAATAP
ncbi:potassium:proton antiporter [Aureococcus anophagefferens]|nr:potassium:proton antiporter [Aureococcus anophagefferens]